MNHRGMIEEINYANDSRVRQGQEGDWYESLNRAKTVATVIIADYDDASELLEEEVQCPVNLSVCGMCRGTGVVVSPGVDSGGLTADDFHDDPDFAEDYFSGRYDEPCPRCHGTNIEPQPDTDTEIGKRVQKFLCDQAQFAAEDHAERMAEMRMGA